MMNRNSYIIPVSVGILFNLFLSSCSMEDYTENKTSQVASSSSSVIEYSFIINKNTGTFHFPDCTLIQYMNRENTDYTKLEYADLVKKGYSPCERCIQVSDNESSTDSTDSLIIVDFTPDKDANRIIASYNASTSSSKITASDITCEKTAGGYHTTIEKDGIKYDIAYAEDFYLQAHASNNGIPENAFIQDMVFFLGAIIGQSNSQQVIDEAIQTGNIVKYYKNSIECSGQSFRYSDDSWY